MEPQPLHLANEFASVRVSVDRDANGPRLLIVDLSTGVTAHLDPLELQSLAWVRHQDLAAIVAPAYREGVVASPAAPPGPADSVDPPEPHLVRVGGGLVSVSQPRDERFARGVQLLRQMVGDEPADRALANHHMTARSVPDELLDWAIENAFGFLLQRPGLTLRDKAIAILGSDLASMASRDALREHVRLALHSGVTPDELYEIAFLLVWYCGMPRVREALGVISEALTEATEATEG